MKFLIILILAAFVVSCSSQKSRIVYPEWYINGKISDERTFYATGKGHTKDAAIKEALRGIAEQIKIKVSTKYKEEIQSSQKYSETKIVSSVETETSNIELTGYKVVKSHIVENDQFLVMIEIEKKSIENQYVKKIQNQNQTIEKSNSFTDFIFLKKMNHLNNELQDLELSHMILSSLSKESTMESKVDEFRKKIEDREALIAFSIITGPQFIRSEQVLREALTKIGYKTSPKDGALRIEISGVSDTKKEGSLFLVRQQTEIKLKDATGNIFSSKTIEEIGASSVSIEDAILNTGAELKLLIKKQGLKKLLDLEAES